MGTKMKGLLKGLKYISQIFEEEKEDEFQIGLPTDVKHVAHIGWDGGPSSVDNPSWMKEFPSTNGGFQSAPLGPPLDPREDPEIKWVSEDSKSNRKEKSSSRDGPDAPKSSRRRSVKEKEDSSDSPKKKDSSSRGKSRRHSKDSSDGSIKSSRQNQEFGHGSDSTSRNLPDIPKKSRRKKSKELVTGESTRSSRLKNASSADLGSPGGEQSQASSEKPVIEEHQDKKISDGN